MSSLDIGLTLHQAGELDGAANVYQSVLATDPKIHRAAFLLGVVNLQRQEWGRAAIALRSAVAQNACEADYHVALGVALRNLGDLDGAFSAYTKAMSLNSSSADVYNNLGALHETAGNQESAAECYQAAIRLRPGFSEAHYNLGNISRFKRRFIEAADHYRRALVADPAHRKAAVNLAVALCGTNNFAEAERVLRQIVSRVPDDARVVSLLGYVMIATGQWNGASELLTDFFARSARQKYISGANPQAMRHDCEQIRYLSGLSYDIPSIARAVETIGSLPGAQYNGTDAASATEGLARVLADTFYIQNCESLDRSPLSDNMVFWGDEAGVLSGAKTHLVIDGLLTNEALFQLRDFCLSSTIWSTSSCGGELIANMHTGFSCPLLFQISGDLKRRMPALFGDQQLIMAWAYRYIGDAPEFGPHADPGLTTVNFWITPDEANLDQNCGGLQIWGVQAPSHYIEQERPAQLETVRELLSSSALEPEVIRYRCNRAVIYPSSAIHSTDRYRFATGYADRRMNVTLLFGDIASRTGH